MNKSNDIINHQKRLGELLGTFFLVVQEIFNLEKELKSENNSKDFLIKTIQNINQSQDT